MSKTRHEHAANENIHKPRVHTRHDNMKARSQWNTQAACHTAQVITWMHAADKNTNCVQHHKTHMGRRARGRANSRPHTHTMRQNMEHECSNPDTKPKLKTWVPGYEHHAPTWNKARRRESAQLEHTRSRAFTWNPDMTGVSGLCHKTMNNTRPKWQNPDTFPYYKHIQGSNICLSICHPSRPIHPFNLLCTASVFLNTINGMMWLPLLVHCH